MSVSDTQMTKIHPNTPEKYVKKSIPRALREQVWLQNIGKHYETKCSVVWCSNMITVFDFHVGHNIPEAKGGKTDISNLRPICARCNLSMGSHYTIDEWNKMSGKEDTCVPVKKVGTKQCCIIC